MSETSVQLEHSSQSECPQIQKHSDARFPPHYGLFLPEGLLTAAIMPPVFEMSINGITPCPLPLHTVRVQFIGVTREAAIRSFPWLFRIPWNEMAMGGCPFCW